MHRRIVATSASGRRVYSTSPCCGQVEVIMFRVENSTSKYCQKIHKSPSVVVEAVRVLKPVPCLICDGRVSNIRIATAVQKRIIVLHLHTTSLAVGKPPLNLVRAAGYSGT
jgi:tRNA(Phe) wybutosine-synthesizing methylase Tyw3